MVLSEVTSITQVNMENTKKTLDMRSNTCLQIFDLTRVYIIFDPTGRVYIIFDPTGRVYRIFNPNRRVYRIFDPLGSNILYSVFSRIEYYVYTAGRIKYSIHVQ